MSENNNALVPTRQPTIGKDLTEIIELGRIFAASGGFPGVSTPALAIVKILAGRELGFPAVASVCGIHMIEGKPSIGSHLLAAAIRGSGRYDYEVLEHTDQVCSVQFKRLLQDGTWKDLKPVERLTLKEAFEKGWTVSNNAKAKMPWLKTPKNMLFARCISNGYKFHCPDLFSGLLVYDQDELEPSAGPIVDASWTVGARTANGAHNDQNTPVPQEPPPDPTLAPQEAQGSPTEQEYEALCALARQHGRTMAEVQTCCQILGVGGLDRAPRAWLPWLQQALTTGLVTKTQVDRITQTLTDLGTDWAKIPDRLQHKYGVRSLSHLLPHQADELERTCKDALSKKLEVAKAQQPAAS